MVLPTVTLNEYPEGIVISIPLASLLAKSLKSRAATPAPSDLYRFCSSNDPRFSCWLLKLVNEVNILFTAPELL